MLPSLERLARERDLLLQVISAPSDPSAGADDEGSKLLGLELPDEAVSAEDSAPDGDCEVTSRPAKIPARRMQQIANQGSKGDLLTHLPKELLSGIAEQYLECPVWHACQLSESSSDMGQVFMDEALWAKFYDGRFREASESPKWQRHHRSPSPSARLSYASLHELERRFREGLYASNRPLLHTHVGVAVLDVRVGLTVPECHPQCRGHDGSLSTLACAALRDGSVVMYDLAPPNTSLDSAVLEGQPPAKSPSNAVTVRLRGRQASGDVHHPAHAAPLREFSPSTGTGGSALCCLPLAHATTSSQEPALLAAGYSQGQLSAWDLLSGKSVAPAAWESAHARRVSALAALCSGQTLLSASDDGLVKAWDLSRDRFGEAVRTFSAAVPAQRGGVGDDIRQGRDRTAGAQGNAAATKVASVAASPQDPALFLTGGHDRQVRLWDARAARVVSQWQQSDWATCVDFHPLLANSRVYSSDKSVHEWDLRHLAQPLQSRHRHRKLISRFRLDPLRLASCSLDGTVKVSSMEAPNMRKASPHASPLHGPQDAPLPHFFHRGSAGCDARTLCASTDYVLSMDFDAERLIVGGINGQVDVYDFSDTEHFRACSPGRSPSASMELRRFTSKQSSGEDEEECPDMQMTGDIGV